MRYAYNRIIVGDVKELLAADEAFSYNLIQMRKDAPLAFQYKRI
jgi:hypothetical protein